MAENNQVDFTQSSVGDRAARRTYLITCSQVNKTKFPTRESFGRCVANYFNSGSGQAKVDYWACCLEQHQDSGEHYHMSVKLTGPKRWKSVKNQVSQSHGQVLHFSDSHDSYYSAYKYVCKTDREVYKSEGHPNLENIGSPRTKLCIKSYRQKHKLSKQNGANNTDKHNNNEHNMSKKAKVARLTHLEVGEFIIAHNIKTVKSLFSVANERLNAGNKDLANFVMPRSKKSLSELVDNAWTMNSAKVDLQRDSLTRMELLTQARESPCVSGCNSQWLQCAMEVLFNNSINPLVFAASVRNLLTKGRGKFRNIFITGPANCGKTFLLSPLQKIYKTFCSPANDKYAWLGVENSEVIFLNDFRYNTEVIAWKEMLLLLEGQTVHLPTPKNIYSADITISNDIPVFATGIRPITFPGKYNTTDDRENEMMAARWKVFEFHHQIAEREQKEMQACPRCFAEFVFSEDL